MLGMTFVQKFPGRGASRPPSRMSLFIEQKTAVVLKVEDERQMLHMLRRPLNVVRPGAQNPVQINQPVYIAYTCL